MNLTADLQSDNREIAANRLKRAHHGSLIANLKYLQLLEVIPPKDEQGELVAFSWQAQRLTITTLS